MSRPRIHGRLQPSDATSAYVLMAPAGFPSPIRIGARAARRVQREVLDFIASRPRGGSEHVGAAVDNIALR